MKFIVLLMGRREEKLLPSCLPAPSCQMHSHFQVAVRKQEIEDRLNSWIVFNEKNKELCAWLVQMENKVLQTADISIEEMIEKLQKVSRSPQMGTVMTTTVSSAFLTPRLRAVWCRRPVSNEMGKGGMVLCTEGGCFLLVRKSGQTRGSCPLKLQSISQVSYGFSSCVVKELPWPKEKDQQQWGS